MKSIMLTLAVLVLAVPALADVNITCVDEGGGVVAVSYDASGEPNLVRAFALDIQLDNDANITAITDVDPDYWVYPGSIDINETTGVVDDYGTPVGDAGLYAGTLPGPDSNGVTVEMGSLYVGAANAPPTSGLLFKFTVVGDCNYVITENAIRGGVVLEDPQLDPTVVGCSGSVGVEPDCFDSGHPDYAEWVAVGKPESWCYKYQCYGDADGEENGNILVGFSRVREQDLGILISGWKVEGYTDPVSHPWIAADFDRTENGNILVGFARIREQDLGILIANWKDDSGIPMGSPNCGGDIDLTP